jgi:hypothetical protein
LMVSGFGRHFLPNSRYLGAPLAELCIVWFFLMMCPLRRATPARRATLLRAAANILRDPQFPRVCFFGFWVRSAASLRPQCCFLSPPKGFTGARSLRNSSCPAYDSVSSEVGSMHSRCVYKDGFRIW